MYARWTISACAGSTVVAAALALGAPTPASALQDVEPPFEWDATYVTPGTSLTLREVRRMPARRNTGTLIQYEIVSRGFSTDDSLSLWRRIGTGYARMPAVLDSAGVVQVLPGVSTTMVGGFVAGEALDVALVSERTSARAHAKSIPFPIEASGDGDCRAAAELLSKTGHLFLLTFSGFGAGEDVQTTVRFKKADKSAGMTADEHGGFRVPMLYERRDKGTASASAVGSTCAVTLEYRVGDDAMEVR